MAEGGATATGLTELQATIDNLPMDVIKALRAVALASAERIKDRAFEILDAKTNGKANRITVITIVPDEEAHVFRVISEGAADKPANLALWFERGTKFMEARPFMRPAGDVETATYRANSERAASIVLEKLGRR